MESASSNHRRTPSGSCAGSRQGPFGDPDAIALEPSAFGCHGPTGWILPSGSSHRHPTDPSGLDGMRPRRFLRDAPEPHATDSFRSLRGAIGRDRKRGGLRAVVSPGMAGALPSGGEPSIGRAEPDKAETLCLPHDVRVRGRHAVRPRGETSSSSGRCGNARQHRNGSTSKPMGASSGAQRKRCVAATDSSVEESPEVGFVLERAVATRERPGGERREGTPAGVRSRIRKEDAR